MGEKPISRGAAAALSKSAAGTIKSRSAMNLAPALSQAARHSPARPLSTGIYAGNPCVSPSESGTVSRGILGPKDQGESR